MINIMTFLEIPTVKKSFIKVWRRNYIYFKKTILVSLFWIVMEPLMYLGAFGFGLGAFVNTINGIPFLEFFFPGLLCTTAMMVPFFEGTYGGFTKLTHQKTYTAILFTPLGVQEVIFGEVLWAASKGFFGVCGVAFISSFFSLVSLTKIFPQLMVLFLLCWTFACLAMLFTSLAKNYDSFIYATSGFIVPMSLIGGVYFPIEQMPKALQFLAYLLPLTHGVNLVRSIQTETYAWTLILSFIYLAVLSLVSLNIAKKRIQNKLVN